MSATGPGHWGKAAAAIIGSCVLFDVWLIRWIMRHLGS